MLNASESVAGAGVPAPGSASGAPAFRPAGWRAAALSALVYVLATAMLGREVLAHLTTHVANDAGDPLLTAALLHWNAVTVPYTEAWWQLPILFPTRDALAFSEHLLGLSVVASPIYWITGSTLATYNITTLLTFPLSALAMYALVARLTRSAPAAFVAGLVFGFAPYRVSQLPHVQMLAAFWAPLALLGLHAFLDTRRKRWLALYGAGWMLQSAANGYCLIFFSLVVALWVAWFVIARRDWRGLVSIGAATAIFAIPLAPIVLKYLAVHGRHGFARSFEEIMVFSADATAVFCGSPLLTFWGWVRVGCRAEGELFPGGVTAALFVAGCILLFAARGTREWTLTRGAGILRALLLTVAVSYTLLVTSILALGPWRLAWGFLQISATGLRKPLLVMLGAWLAVTALTPSVRGAFRRSPVLAFYVVTAFITWLLALGPRIHVMGEPTRMNGPFSWLMVLPGVSGLRVPARFWLMTLIGLGVVAGIVAARSLAGRTRVARATIVLLLAAGVLGDGWMGGIAAQAVPPPVPDAAPLRGRVVLELPVDDAHDIAAQLRAITGGWRTVNGYSGYWPNYYPALREAVRQEVDGMVEPFQEYGELEVIVPKDAPRLTTVIERQPGVTVTARNALMTEYRLPARPAPAPLHRQLPLASVESWCAAGDLRLMTDADPVTRWRCLSAKEDRVVTAELREPASIAAVTQGVGPYNGEFPWELRIETSMDGTNWEPAWSGGVLGQAIAGGLADPRSMTLTLRFAPRQARFVRLTCPGRSEPFYWTITELAVWQ